MLAGRIVLLVVIFISACQREINKPKPPVRKKTQNRMIQKPPPDNKRLQAAQQAVQYRLHHAAKNGVIHSAAVGVVYHNRLVFARYYRATEKTPFGLASITKTFTGLAIMQLINKKKLQLSTPITDIYPALMIDDPDYGKQKIEIRHLLAHISGMPDTRSYHNPGWIAGKQSQVGFALPKKRYPTGVYMAYSNHGLQLLGAVVAKISGKSLRQYFQQEILQPLKMMHSTINYGVNGAYGVNTSLVDLATWAKVWLNDGRVGQRPRLLTEGTVAKMLIPQVHYPPGRNRAFMGLIWRAKQQKDHILYYHHGGAAARSMAWIQMYPAQQAAVLILSTTAKVDTKALQWRWLMRKRLEKIILTYDHLPDTAFDFQASLPDSQTQAALAGRYKNRLTGSVLQLVFEQGNLYRIRSGKRLFKPESLRVYREKGQWTAYEALYKPASIQPIGLATRTAFYQRMEPDARD